MRYYTVDILWLLYISLSKSSLASWAANWIKRDIPDWCQSLVTTKDKYIWLSYLGCCCCLYSLIPRLITTVVVVIQISPVYKFSCQKQPGNSAGSLIVDRRRCNTGSRYDRLGPDTIIYWVLSCRRRIQQLLNSFLRMLSYLEPWCHCYLAVRARALQNAFIWLILSPAQAGWLSFHAIGWHWLPIC